VLNKIDALADARELLVWLNKYPEAIAVSARTGEGIEQLTQLVLQHTLGEMRTVQIETPLADAKTVDFLEKRTQVLDRQYEDGHVTLTVRLGRRHVDQLLSQGARIRIDGLEGMEGLKKAWNLPEPASIDRGRPPHEKYH
jgi:GTP-binding protein HflX